MLWTFLFGPSEPDATLTSPHSRETCLQKLKAEIDPPWIIFGSKPVLGWSRLGVFVAHKRIYYGNSFRTRMTATFLEQAGATTVRCRFGISPFVQLFTTVWFGLLALGGTAMMGSAVYYATIGSAVERERMGLDGIVIFFVAPPLMLLLGIALVRFCRWLARGERSFLETFMRRVLAAKTSA